MVLSEVYDRFAQESPAAVMMRGILENCLSAERLDELFERTAEVQYTRELAFSTLVRLMSQVVTRVRPSMHAAHGAAELDVSARSLYGKLQHVEPAVSRALVGQTACELTQVVKQLGGSMPELVPGYRVKVLDGNHLAGTDRRLKPLRRQRGAALPGQALAVLDPALGLVVDVFPCEDAHAQERSLVNAVIATVERKDLLIADRNFCTTRFVFGIAQREAAFVVRQHKNSLRWETCGERTPVGTSTTGCVFEEPVRLFNESGGVLLARRVIVKLNQATRDGATEIQILTNLPAAISATIIAELYLQRWLIETVFQQLTVDLCCEVQTLGYPQAALFGFCVAVLCYNALSVVKAALRAAESESPSPAANTPARAKPRRDEWSAYYLAHEISAVWQGMKIMLPDSFWQSRFGRQTPEQLADELRRLAQAANRGKYRKRPQNATRRAQAPPTMPGSHVATARVLKRRDQQ